MKKILLITAMFMAMNTWSADYKVCYEEKLTSLSDCSIELIKDGYICISVPNRWNIKNFLTLKPNNEFYHSFDVISVLYIKGQPAE